MIPAHDLTHIPAARLDPLAHMLAQLLSTARGIPCESRMPHPMPKRKQPDSGHRFRQWRQGTRRKLAFPWFPFHYESRRIAPPKTNRPSSDSQGAGFGNLEFQKSSKKWRVHGLFTFCSAVHGLFTVCSRFVPVLFSCSRFVHVLFSFCSLFTFCSAGARSAARAPARGAARASARALAGFETRQSQNSPKPKIVKTSVPRAGAWAARVK